MKETLLKVLPMVAAIVFATSCSKDDNTEPKPDVTSKSSVTMSFKVGSSNSLSKIGIAEDNGQFGISPKFDGDEVINFADAYKLVTGSVTLTAANIQNDGKTAEFEVTFNGSDENLTKFKNGDISLTATIGEKLKDLSSQTYASLDDAMRANSYQVSTEGITYSENLTNITFEEQTAYLEIGLPVTVTSVKINEKDYDLTLGSGWIALPVGTKVTSEALSLSEKEVDAAKVYTVYRKAFSVSPNKKIHFSTGNLQYNVRTSEWRFAENQYDRCFSKETEVGSDYTDLKKYPESFNENGLCKDGWIDLFGWGMWLEGQTPNTTNQDETKYLKNVTDGNFKGASAIGTAWETLTYEECFYLFEGRKDAIHKYGLATICATIEGENRKGGNKGLMILPDDWSCPEGLTFNGGKDKSGFTSNNYTEEEWKKMESAGAIFLPFTGALVYDMQPYYDGQYRVFYPTWAAYYWTSTLKDYPEGEYAAKPAWDIEFSKYALDYECQSRRMRGQAVRLVRGLSENLNSNKAICVFVSLEEEW